MKKQNVEPQEGEVIKRPTGPRVIGTVLSFDPKESTGVIVSNDGKTTVSVHGSRLRRGVSALEKGQKVRFSTYEDYSGQLQADSVEILRPIGSRYLGRKKGSGKKRTPWFKATVRWFDLTRGFGFVVLNEMEGDVFLPLGKLQNAEISPEDITGKTVYVQVTPGPKGGQKRVSAIKL